MQRIDFLAVDLGATSGRTMLATFDGQAVSMRELTRFHNNMIPLGGHLFWDIAALYHEILLGLGKAAADGASLKSIGIDTWGCDFAFFGKDGQLLGLPYCYRDSHTEGAMEQFFAKMPATDIYRRTGIQFMDFNSIFQIDTLKRNGCTALEAADKILFIPDALIYMLTGQSICEYTVASTSQMLNPLTKDLDKNPDAEPYFEMLNKTGGDYFKKEHFILFNLAVGGTFPGIYNSAGITALPEDGSSASMYVDYIKVYQK